MGLARKHLGRPIRTILGHSARSRRTQRFDLGPATNAQGDVKATRWSVVDKPEKLRTIDQQYSRYHSADLYSVHLRDTLMRYGQLPANLTLYQ